ncbi:two-component sensor histidine kinase [Sporanaerobium hydrogeniformans]|uniref:Two-component sensor histidine kinase n=1 Tax=Sporanaerobium hydrogeniformans TaxID=3072179 RepID=A0AC61DA51_9FIRM|nr:HAMP domain-containing sensor histidine kinase [Sporanaerobium hydrogeniformans]PHV70110.1 two-component sensor histidine kinase [Sporanaerobium hydrogeniformans]
MKHTKWGIKWQLFSYLSLFVALLLIILWLFQVVFLESFYKRIKLKEIENAGTRVAKNINNSHLESILETIADEKDLAFLITDETGYIVHSINNSADSIFSHMTAEDYLRFIQNALRKGGEDIRKIDYKLIESGSPQIKNYSRTMPKPQKRQLESVLYTKVIQKTNTSANVVMINATISPVDATVYTLRTQLIYVTVILLFMAFLLAWFISKKIAKPIIRINNSAKELAKGNYTSYFEGGSYKEISELAETLNYANEELSKTEHFRQELLANVSHDLRTPLTLITGYAEVMRDLPGENTPENTQVIIDEGKRLTELVNDMLDLSKLQAKTQVLQPTTFNLTASIHDILSRYTRLREQEGYIFHFSYKQDVWVSADALRLSQVLYNLINNAINYTGEDKTVSVNQIIKAEAVRIEIIDTGIGIAKENLPYIWDRYYKVDKTHKRAFVGTGLGLSIVRSILESHHALYGVISEEGKGSTFWFELPIVKNL